MRKFVTRLIIMLAVFLFAATSANALDISAEFNLGNSTLTNVPTVNAPNDWTLDLTNGDVIALDVYVENAPMDVVTAAFSSLITDSVQVSFAGGAYFPILTEETCVGFLCSPATLSPGIPSPISKPNDPESLATGTTEWVQSVAHTNVDGTAGAGVVGVGDVAISLAYVYNGAGGADNVMFDADTTSGDAFAGVTLPIIYSSAVINVPEPSALLASMASLGTIGLIAVGRRRA